MSRPPRIAQWLLERCLSPEHDAVIGDMAEEYIDTATTYGRSYAALRFWGQTLYTIPAIVTADLIWHRTMFKNYLIVAFRNLAKYKSFSAINVLGLACAMSVCLLLILFVKELKSYDQFHEGSEQIYRVYANYKPDSKPEPDLYATSPASLSAVMQREIPGVEAVALRRFGGMAAVGGTASGDLKGEGVRLSGLYAESSFFDVFSFRLQEGNATDALAQPHTIVLSADAAAKFFRDANPVGQTLSIEGQGDYLVTGLLEEPDGKSHLRFEVLVSFATLQASETEGDLLADWQQTVRQYYTFLRLSSSVAATTVEQVLPDLIARHYVGRDDQFLSGLHLQGLTDINMGLDLENQLSFPMPAVAMYFLFGLGFIIMLAAAFNYIGLSVARALRRTREVGVRKVMGAHRSQIIRQFLTEAVVTALGGLCLGWVLLYWLVPAFNSLTPIQVSEMTISPDWADGSIYLLFFAFTVLVGVLSGLYPALYLSAFVPVRVLKGLFSSRQSSGLFLRKSLMVAQFGFSLVFIITTLVLYQQLRFLVETDYGFEQEHIVNVALQDVPYEQVKVALSQQASVIAVSATSHLPVSGRREGAALRTEEMDESLEAVSYAIDEVFLENLGLTLVAGRNFSDDFTTDQEEAILLNETAVQVLGFASPLDAVGQQVYLSDESPTRHIVGVIQDYQYDLPFIGIGPLVLQYTPERFQYANVRLHAGEAEGFKAYLEAAWPSFNTVYPLQYSFFEEQIEEGPELMLFREFMGIVGLLAGFAILIACLGLLGMVGYNAEMRIKEIGMRKVLGASVAQIIMLLSKDFVRLIVVAVVLAAPLAWFMNGLWLQEMENRIEMGVEVVVIGVVLLLMLAFITLGSQTLRAARANPVESLRHE